MSITALAQLKYTLKFKQLTRIALVVPYRVCQIIVIFKDAHYQHMNLINQQILHQGIMPFTPYSYISSQTKQDIVFIGQMQDKNQFLICWLQTRNADTWPIIMRTIPKNISQIEVKFYMHVIEYNQENSIDLYLAKLVLSIEKGIVISLFNFIKDEWSQDLLYLSSRYLNYKFINNGYVKNFEMQGKSSHRIWSFTLIANGDKYDSINYTQIDVSQTIEHKIDISTKLKMQITIMNEIKLGYNFICIGAQFNKNYDLILIGNSRYYRNEKQKQDRILGTVIKIKNIDLLNQNQYNIQFNKITQNIKLKYCGSFIKKYLGLIDNNMLFIVEIEKFIEIHLVSIDKKDNDIFQTIQLIQFNKKPKNSLQLTLDNNGFQSYTHICEQFFQKIQDFPSILEIILVVKIPKSFYYKTIVQKLENYPVLTKIQPILQTLL